MKIERSGGGGGGSSSSASIAKLSSIATKTNTPSNGVSAGDATHQSVTYKVKHTVVTNASLIRLVYSNWGNANNTGITIGAAIDGKKVTFNNGADTTIIIPGAIAVSDPLGINVEAGDIITTYNFVTVGVGEDYPFGAEMESGEGMGQGDCRTGGTITASTERAYHPIAIIGVSDTPSVLLLGDSITAGGGASHMVNSYANRAAIGWSRGVLIAGSSGEEAISAQNNLTDRMRLTEYATHAVVFYGANDFFYEETLEDLKSAVTVIGNTLVAFGITPYLCTMCPRNTSTDSFSTEVNQTEINTHFAPGAGSPKGLYNNWVRTTPPPFAGYIDVADAVETSRDSGKWKPFYTADGTHPKDAGHQAIADVLDLVKIVAGQVVSVNPNPDTTAPNAPTLLTASTGTTVETIDLSWTNPTDTDFYSTFIYRDGVKITEVVSSTAYTDTGLTGGVTYSYEISSTDYTGNESAHTAAVTAIPDSAPIITDITDSFDRAVSTTTMGNTDTGETWEYLKGVWGITAGGHGYAAGGTADSAAVVLYDNADATVQVTFAVSPNSTRLICRATAENAYIMVQRSATSYEMYRRNPGFVSIGNTGTSVTPADGDVVKLVCLGSNIKLFVNGTMYLDITETFNQTAGTKHGIGAGSASAEFESFSITP